MQMGPKQVCLSKHGMRQLHVERQAVSSNHGRLRVMKVQLTLILQQVSSQRIVQPITGQHHDCRLWGGGSDHRSRLGHCRQ